MRLRVEDEVKLLQNVRAHNFERARNYMLAFTQWTYPEYRVNWHHRLICKYLNRFVAGDIRRLMIFTPPRHGKSELVSRRLPAFLLGRNPDEQIILASYSDSLASLMNRDVQRIMETEEYQKLFPATKIPNLMGSGGRVRNAGEFEILGRRGRFKTAGIGTGITGQGANTAIIDDPVKDQKDADSEVVRQNTWEWYTSTLYTRLMNPRRVLVTMTRWHEDDLAGRLLRAAKEDPLADQWTILNLPAIATGEDPLDPRALGEPLWSPDFNADIMAGIKATAGPRVWAALYQQSPRPDGGGLFSEGMFELADCPNIDAFDYVFTMADTAYDEKKQNDYTVFTTFGMLNGQLYIIDVWRRRLKASEVEESIVPWVKQYQRYGYRGCYIEPKGHGIYLNQRLPRLGVMIPSDTAIKDFFADRRWNKVERANNVVPFLSNRKVYMNRAIHMVDELIAEALNFPNGTHDDFVDTLIDGVKFGYSMPLGILDVL